MILSHLWTQTWLVGCDEGAATPLFISELDCDVDFGMDLDPNSTSTCVLDFYCSLSQEYLKDES